MTTTFTTNAATNHDTITAWISYIARLDAESRVDSYYEDYHSGRSRDDTPHSGRAELDARRALQADTYFDAVALSPSQEDIYVETYVSAYNDRLEMYGLE